jgi:hypothetical protein
VRSIILHVFVISCITSLLFIIIESGVSADKMGSPGPFVSIQNITHDDHLFIMLNGKSMIHHPGCHCVRLENR